MFAPKGYISLWSVYERVWHDFDLLGADYELFTKGNLLSECTGASHPMLNILDDIEWQILDLFAVDGQVAICSPHGTLQHISRKILDTSLGVICTPDQADLFSAADSCLTLTRDEADYLTTIIHERKINENYEFEKLERSFPSFFDRRSYTVSTQPLTVIESLFSRLYPNDDPADEFLTDIFGYTEIRLAKTISQFEGWSIVAKINQIPKRLNFKIKSYGGASHALKLHDTQRNMGCSSKAILSIKKSNPSWTKAQVKQQFPTTSARQFDRFWKQAAQINPSISKAGRKS